MKMKDKYYYSDGTTTSNIEDESKTLHREDGPAIEHADGTKHWYMNGNLRPKDGPAVEHTNGTKEWYLNGKCLNTLTKKHLTRYMKLNNLTLAHLLTDSDELVRISASSFCKGAV